MSKRLPQQHKVFSDSAPALSSTAFMLPVFEEVEDDDAEPDAPGQRVVKAGFVECIAKNHSLRKDGSLVTPHFTCHAHKACRTGMSTCERITGLCVLVLRSQGRKQTGLCGCPRARLLK